MIYQSIKKIKELFDFNKAEIEVIGSYSNPDLIFASDIDLRGIKEKPNLKVFIFDLRVLVKQIYQKKSLPQVFFSDFKAGLNRGKPIKWTITEIIKNKKELETSSGYKTITLEEAMMTGKSTIKLDLILNYKGRFKEVTCNYFLTLTDSNGIKFITSPDETDKIEDIYKREYLNLKDVKPIKALKRLYLIASRNEDLKKLEKKLIKFLNSKIGFINYTVENLKIINDLVKNYDVDMKLIKNNFQIIEKTLSNTIIKREIHQLSLSSRSKLIKNLPLLIDKITQLFITSQTDNFILTLASSLKGT